MFPNPVHDDVLAVGQLGGGEHVVELSDALGRSRAITTVQGATAQLDLAGVASGVYTLTVHGIAGARLRSARVLGQ